MRNPTSPTPLESACSKTDEVQRELEVASAELGLTHGALDRHLPPDQRTSDVAWAIAQNEALERKVAQAAEDLEQVCELLEQAKAEAAAA
ncbi:MAG TPA: hypothetical protein VIL30_09765 [Ramlibacter sp.]|jgi:hypothetical protein